MEPQITLKVVMPEILVTGLAIAILILGLFPRGKKWLLEISLTGLLGAFIYTIASWGDWGIGFNNMVVRDSLSVAFECIFLTGAILGVLVSEYFYRRILNQGEYISLILLSTVGMMLMAIAGDMIIIFLGLETMSIALYILVGFKRAHADSIEAALKYFLLGAFATGFLLYGMAFVYGATGSTNLRYIIALFAEGKSAAGLFMYIGLGFLIVGLGFKVALVPFHMWVPDVYQGAPTPVTAFMSAGAKAAGFAAFLRIFMEAVGVLSGSWTTILWSIAVLTMTLGNIVALTQTNIKRMLAYSSIAHAGYILLGIIAGTQSAYSAVIFYVLVYTFMNIGAFGIIAYLERRESETDSLSDYAGLGLMRPWIGAAMTIFMLSLAGFPPTAGFLAKFYIFRAAIEAGYVGLTVIAVLNALLSVYYYIGVVVLMYMREPVIDFSHIPPKPLVLVGIAAAAIGTIYFGIMPDDVMTHLLSAF